MSQPATTKCACVSCGVHLEYPVESEGVVIACPQCGSQTPLTSVTPPQETVSNAKISTEDLTAPFQGPVPRTPVSFLYQAGLVFVTLGMLALPVIYLGMIAAGGWGVWYWATHFTFLLSGAGGIRFGLVKLALYAGPLFAGVVLVFFMVKPLFARRAPSATPLALNPGAEPELFAFVTGLCRSVGAPFPTRIDIDCQMNASASFRRGAFSFLGNDLVLTIGLPLVASLNLQEFTGVLAHEFGHFTQPFAMRLTYIIRSVNAWFGRVVYERDAWDLMLVEAAETEDGKVALVVACAQFAVWTSRQLLTLLMMGGHAIGCFMMRQMEYDADSYQIKVAGSAGFENTHRKLHVLGAALKHSYKNIRTAWNLNKRLPEDFPAYFMRQASAVPEHELRKMEDSLGLEPSGLMDTHPSNGDRIRQARIAANPGIFHFDAPATTLFSNFEAASRQVTLLHYEDDLGLPLMMAKLVPVAGEEGRADTAEASAPSKFKLGTTPPRS